MLEGNNNGPTLLLAWINQQRSFLGFHNTIYDFQHLKETGFVYDLFQNINQQYFGTLNHLVFQMNTYLPALEEYLIEVEGKKLTRCYKKQILEHQSIEEMIKIAIFLLLQSNQKSDFITRIVEMNVQIQTYLMEEIKKIQLNIQNFIEIKDILTTVQKLEEENQTLKQKIKNYGEVNHQLNELVADSRNQNQKIEKEIHRYQSEKKQVLEELDIIDLKEYIELYRCIKTQNIDLNYCVQEMQQKRKQTETQNKHLKDRITEDCQIINTLNDQVISLRNSFSVMKEEMSTLSFSQNQDNSQDMVLRQNKNIGNVKMRQSIGSCLDRSSIFLRHLDDEEDDHEQEHLLKYNHEIMQKLQTAYKTITDLTNQITVIKDQRSKLLKKNNFLEKKMGDLKKQQSRFMKELRLIGL